MKIIDSFFSCILHAFSINSIHMLQDVNTVLGIHVGQDLISWSLLNRNCEVLQWNYKTFLSKRTKENIHSLLLEVNIELKSFIYLVK